jgi:hypothetical protein
MSRQNRLCVLLLASPILLAGCSPGIPGLGALNAPDTTGSVASPLDIEKPLPRTLAYSDAARIGQAATAALWQAGSAVEDWVNAATGSSGTLERRAAADTGEPDACRGFDTTVTSIGGVHRYSGRICRRGEGRSVLQVDPSGDDIRS